MKPRNRKLLDTTNTNEYPDPHITLTNPPIPPLPLLVPNNSTAKKPAKPPEPFDSSMALTIVVLFTAFFFMGLFSIYIRRFADDNPVDFSRRRRRQNQDIPISVAGALSEIRRARGGGGGGGVDTSTIQSLPVCVYHGDAKHTIIDCAICLSEFEDEEEVKMIPSCGHVFHPSCIDTWLSSRVSCPLCRTTRLIPAKDVGLSGRKSTAESGDTCTSSMRRNDSYSSLEEP